MAKVTSKPAGKFKINAGGKGKMQKFKGVGTQKPGVVEVAGSGGGTDPGAKIPTGGTGKIGGKQVGVKAVKPGQTGVR
jgi:hypothetical protein